MADLLGPELITNGGFDSADGWSFGGAWSWSEALGRALLLPSVSNSILSQTLNGLVAGETYRVTFNASTPPPAGLIVTLGGVSGGSFGGGATTDYTVDIECGSTTSLIVRPAYSNATGSIDEISVRKIIGENDIGVYYNIDEKGWVLIRYIYTTDSYLATEHYVNRTGKRIKFKFTGHGGATQIREYKIMEPEIEDDR